MRKLNGKTSGRFADNIFKDVHKETCSKVGRAGFFFYDIGQ